MTGKERLAVGFFISLSMHYFLLGGFSTPHSESSTKTIMILDLNQPDTGVMAQASMVMEQAPEGTCNPDEDAADRRRSALAHYLEDLQRAIHARRMLTKGDAHGLVGNARFSLTITKGGGFKDVDLERSSGIEALDKDAMQAIHAASGVVPRPACLGKIPLRVKIAVKYQFGL